MTTENPTGIRPDGPGLALFTDLYELTMLQAYYREGMQEEAVFSLFARRLPGQRNYLLACGLDSVLGYLENLRLADADLDYLTTLEQFSDDFIEHLAGLRFEGSVRAVPEGTPVFANEPMLEVTAPLPQAQLIETLVMNQVHVQTVLASKAARVVGAAAGRPVIDFGARRMHGIDAAVKAARAFHIAGVTATSNVLAGRLYDLPLSGTMAHSYIQAHADESAAFQRFAGIYPDTVLLVDTYDTLAGVRKVIELVRESGLQVSAVRLDSGDLAALARESRRLLDAAGLEDLRILASGGLDEHTIAAMVADGVPIDGFGVGTRMGVSSDAPDLDIAYKLCQYAGSGRLKLSADKPVLPGPKQVFRITEGGADVGDIIAGQDEELEGRPLLQPVMQAGTRLPAGETNLEKARQVAAAGIARLPESIRATTAAERPYPVTVSKALQARQTRIAQQHRH